MKAPSSTVKYFLFLILVFLPTPALTGEPGSAALHFLDSVRVGNLNLELEGNTALLADITTKSKLMTIRDGIARLRNDLGDGQLEIGKVKKDGDFAAVIVRKIGGVDPSEIRVFPVAMLKRGGEWVAAPVLGSFENAVVGYTLSLKERLSGLEAWMMETRVEELKSLISQSAGHTRELIRKKFVGKNMKGDDLLGIIVEFQKACSARDRAAILGFLGGLAATLPADWPSRLVASGLAIEASGPWRLLVSPEVVRVPVKLERESHSARVSMACLDPTVTEASKRILILHFDFEKDESGHWRMDLPHALSSADWETLNTGDGIDPKLLDLFPVRFRELAPAIAASTAQEAVESTLESLSSGSLENVLERAHFGGSGGDGRAVCVEAARLWWSLHRTDSLCMPLQLGFKEHGDTAVAVFQWFSVSDPERFVPETMYFSRTPEGWLWSPRTDVGDSHGVGQKLSRWRIENETAWRSSWHGELLRKGISLPNLDSGRAATDAEVSRLMKNWMTALASKDVRAALSLSAWLGEEGGVPMKGIRGLGRNFSDYRDGEWKVKGILRSESWAAASLQQTFGGETRHVFIPVVITGAGPRLLPEVDLVAAGNRTRKFLNESSFERLGNFAGKGRVEELKNLFGAFENRINEVE